MCFTSWVRGSSSGSRSSRTDASWASSFANRSFGAWPRTSRAVTPRRRMSAKGAEPEPARAYDFPPDPLGPGGPLPEAIVTRKPNVWCTERAVSVTARERNSAAGVGARGRVALRLRGELGREQRGAVHEVVLAHLELVEREACEHLGHHDDAGEDHGRSLGVDADHPRDLLDAKRRESGERLLDRRRAEPVAVDAFGIRVPKAEVDSGERRDGAGDPERARRADLCGEAGKGLPDMPTARGDLLGAGRIAAEVSLRQPDTAEVEACVKVHAVGAADDHLGRAAADVHKERAAVHGTSRRRAPEREKGLVIAAQEARRESVAPLDLAEERLPVLGVANGARRDCQRALGTGLLERPPVLDKGVPDPRDGDRQQPAAVVDTFAEPGDHEPPVELLDLAICHVRDEESCRVRAEVDDRDPRHFRGVTWRIRRTASTESPSAHPRTPS